MHRFIVATLLIAASVLAPAQTAPWKVYDYSDEGFTASYPSLPDLQRKSVDTPSGTFELRSYVAGAGDSTLIVGVCDYGTISAGKDAARMLEGAKNSTLLNSVSHLVSEKAISLGANQGIEFVAENDSTHFVMRMYMVETTLYETLVASPLNKPYDETAKFLDSFQLVTRTKY